MKNNNVRTHGRKGAVRLSGRFDGRSLRHPWLISPAGTSLRFSNSFHSVVVTTVSTLPTRCCLIATCTASSLAQRLDHAFQESEEHIHRISRQKAMASGDTETPCPKLKRPTTAPAITAVMNRGL